MLKSLERELNNFSEQTSVLVRQSLLKSKKGNFIIPKERKSVGDSINDKILFNDEYHIHNSSELIPFKQLQFELNDQRTDQTTDLVKIYNEDFEITNDFNFFANKSANPNVKLLGKILDCLLTNKGWENWKTYWYIENSENKGIISIDRMGKIGANYTDKQYFYSLGFDQNSLVYLDQKIDRKMGLVDTFKLKDIIYAVKGNTLEERKENLESYLSNHSLSFLIRFEKIDSQKDEIIKIIVAVEVPEKLTGDSYKLIKYSFNVQYDIFDMVTNQILARKKLLNEFGLSRYNFSKLGDIKREKTIWINQGDGNIYAYEIENQKEIDLLEESLKYIKTNTKKGYNVSWTTMEEIFIRMEKYYSKYENENAYIPSGPDTSKFIATKSGWIKFAKKFTVDISKHSGLGKYFHYGLQVGGNFKYGRPKIILEYILLFAAKNYGLPKYGDGSKVDIKFSSGTNWSAVGIG